MPRKIQKLTQPQIARFPEFVKRWTDIGLSTEPASREKAERAMRQIYQAGGLPGAA